MSARDRLARSAATLFASAGNLARPATLVRVEAASYDPAGGAVVESTTAHDGVIIPDRDMVRGNGSDPVSEPGDRSVWARGFASPPRRGDRLSFDGVTAVVIAVEDLAGAGALWRLTLRDIEAP